MSVLDKAVAERRMVAIDDVMNDLPQPLAEAGEQTFSRRTIIDIRHPDEVELKPLKGVSEEVLTIPFYRLSTALSELPSDVLYLLYCDKGVMSQLHVGTLQEEGRTNIGIYRP